MKKFYALLLSSACGISAFAGSYDLQLTGLDIQSVSVINKEVAISGTVMNAGTETVHSFILNWNDGSANHEALISGLSIEPGTSFTFSHPAKFTPEIAKKYTLTVEVKDPDGFADITIDNNKMSKDIAGTSREAVKRVVAEEATGTWCGWCPRGAVYMEQMADDYGDLFIGIAVHNSDPMEVNEYDAAIGDLISGYPSVVLDRDQVIDPSAMGTKIPGRLDNNAVADVNVHGYYDETEEVLHVTITAEFLSADADLDYRLNAVITEDDVTGTSSGYAQTNYYSGGASGTMGGYEDLPYTVPASDMVYEFVARALADGWEGTDGSVPSEVTEGLYVTQEYEIDIDGDWNIDNIHVIGMLIDHDGDDEILNANSVRLSDITLAANDMTADYKLAIYPNPAVNTTNIALDLASATDLSMQITDMNGNVVAAQQYGAVSGKLNLPVNTASFASGIYLVQIVAGNDVITQKLNVIR